MRAANTEHAACVCVKDEHGAARRASGQCIGVVRALMGLATSRRCFYDDKLGVGADGGADTRVAQMTGLPVPANLRRERRCRRAEAVPFSAGQTPRSNSFSAGSRPPRSVLNQSCACLLYVFFFRRRACLLEPLPPAAS